MKKLFAFASKTEIPFVIVIGKKEIANKEITIKNLISEKQETLPFDLEKIANYIKRALS